MPLSPELTQAIADNNLDEITPSALGESRENWHDAFLLAAQKGHANILAHILNAASQENHFSIITSNENSSIKAAATNGNLSCVKYILAVIPSDHRTAMIISGPNSALRSAVTKEHINIVNHFIEAVDDEFSRNEIIRISKVIANLGGLKNIKTFLSIAHKEIEEETASQKIIKLRSLRSFLIEKFSNPETAILSYLSPIGAANSVIAECLSEDFLEKTEDLRNFSKTSKEPNISLITEPASSETPIAKKKKLPLDAEYEVMQFLAPQIKNDSLTQNQAFVANYEILKLIFEHIPDSPPTRTSSRYSTISEPSTPATIIDSSPLDKKRGRSNSQSSI